MRQMRRVRMVLLLIVAGVAWSAQAAAQEMPPMPTPGPEHQVLKMDEGVWDAVVEISPPGAPAMTSKGVETNVMGCGGLCLASEFNGEMAPGMSFQGRGLTTYDPAKKKYVGTWTDSMSRGLATAESSYDPATKKVTGWMEGPDMTGNISKSKSVSEYTDPDHRVMTMYTVAGGAETQTMRITYTRRK